METTLLDDTSIETQILHTLLPLKYEQNEFIPTGLIFIGLGTHQTTGLGMHVFSYLIPTVERENLDMQNPHIEKWNKEVLSSMGQIVRFIYDQLMLDKNQLKSDLVNQLVKFSFQKSIPNEKIGILTKTNNIYILEFSF